MKKLLPILLIAANVIIVTACSPSNTSTSSCEQQLAEAKKELEKWTIPALQKGSVGCPSFSTDSPLSKLEKIAKENNQCRDKTIGILVEFYSVFPNHPNYAMCGLLQRKEKFIATTLAVDGKVCVSTRGNVESCFAEVLKTIFNLKMRGDINEAFELAKKTADSGDVTGISQLVLATMYDYGNGTDKNTALAIHWYKEAAQRLDDKNLHASAMMGVAVNYETLGNYAEALSYARQCAAEGEAVCGKAIERLSKLIHR